MSISFVIQTFTMNPDIPEDRIRLDIVTPEGAYYAVHITRRLADRFVPVLASKAEGQIEGGIPKDLALSMQQEALRTERDSNPLPAVPVTPGQRPFLCQTIHLSDREDGLLWTMTDDTAFEAHMVLDTQGQRAVLDVLLITYRALEWSEEAFPEWVRERGQVQAPAPRMLN